MIVQRLTDTFRVGPEGGSFMGEDTKEVNALLELAADFQQAKAEIIRDYEQAISQAGERANRRHAELCAITQGKIAGL